MFSFLDETFGEWATLLSDDEAWPGSAGCPDHALFWCCPRVRRLGEEPITHVIISPGHAFSYALMRRVAETIVQWAGCLLLPANCLAILLATMAMSTSRGNNSCGWRLCDRLKSIFPVLLAMPLSIVLICLVLTKREERGGGGTTKTFGHFLTAWEAKKSLSSSRMPPSVLNLFSVFSLHLVLYPKESMSLTGTEYCDAVRLSLSWWSILLFITLIYGLVALITDVILWRPIRNLYIKLTHNPECRKRAFSPRSKATSSCAFDFTTDRLNILRSADRKENPVECHYPDPMSELRKPHKANLNMKSEYGDGVWTDVNHRLVTPRYISRGTYTCLEEPQSASSCSSCSEE